jgi:hypothetical protein
MDGEKENKARMPTTLVSMCNWCQYHHRQRQNVSINFCDELCLLCFLFLDGVEECKWAGKVVWTENLGGAYSHCSLALTLGPPVASKQEEQSSPALQAAFRQHHKSATIQPVFAIPTHPI